MSSIHLLNLVEIVRLLREGEVGIDDTTQRVSDVWKCPIVELDMAARKIAMALMTSETMLPNAHRHLNAAKSVIHRILAARVDFDLYGEVEQLELSLA